MEYINKQLLLDKRPTGMPEDDCWKLNEEIISTIGSNEIIIEVKYLSIDPTPVQVTALLKDLPITILENKVIYISSKFIFVALNLSLTLLSNKNISNNIIKSPLYSTFKYI